MDNEELTKENEKLRAMVANGEGECAYCKLPRADWGKCASGFPGCARSDDAFLCPHVLAVFEETPDANRYRWLCNNPKWAAENFMKFSCLEKHAFDEAIDAILLGVEPEDFDV